MVGFIQKFFDSTLSISSLSIHVCSLYVWFAIIAKLCLLSYLRMCVSKGHDGTFLWCLFHWVPLVLLEIVSCRVCVSVWCCGISVVYFTTLLASASLCSLPLMLVESTKSIGGSEIYVGWMRGALVYGIWKKIIHEINITNPKFIWRDPWKMNVPQTNLWGPCYYYDTPFLPR